MAINGCHGNWLRKLVMHFVNVLVEELRMQQTMNVVKANFLQPIICGELENEAREGRNGFCFIRHVVLLYMLDQEECELREEDSDDELIDEKVDENLKASWKLLRLCKGISDLPSAASSMECDHLAALYNSTEGSACQ